MSFFGKFRKRRKRPLPPPKKNSPQRKQPDSADRPPRQRVDVPQQPSRPQGRAERLDIDSWKPLVDPDAGQHDERRHRGELAEQPPAAGAAEVAAQLGAAPGGRAALARGGASVGLGPQERRRVLPPSVQAQGVPLLGGELAAEGRERVRRGRGVEELVVAPAEEKVRAVVVVKEPAPSAAAAAAAAAPAGERRGVDRGGGRDAAAARGWPARGGEGDRGDAA